MSHRAGVDHQLVDFNVVLYSVLPSPAQTMGGPARYLPPRAVTTRPCGFAAHYPSLLPTRLPDGTDCPRSAPLACPAGGTASMLLGAC
jgi:hypothetical protein